MAIGFYNAAVQALCLLVCAPLIAGIVNKTKATLQKRQTSQRQLLEHGLRNTADAR